MMQINEDGNKNKQILVMVSEVGRNMVRDDLFNDITFSIDEFFWDIDYYTVELH